MSSKQNSVPGHTADKATEVFRQFAWHLAGSLAAAGSSRPAGKPSKPAAGKRG